MGSPLILCSEVTSDVSPAPLQTEASGVHWTCEEKPIPRLGLLGGSVSYMEGEAWGPGKSSSLDASFSRCCF